MHVKIISASRALRQFTLNVVLTFAHFALIETLKEIIANAKRERALSLQRYYSFVPLYDQAHVLITYNLCHIKLR